MGWFISNDNSITTYFEGGVETNTGYIGLKDSYSIQSTDNGLTYKCEIAIGVWISKEKKLLGEKSLQCKNIPNIIQFEITGDEFSSIINNNSIAGFLIAKAGERIKQVFPAIKYTLVEDF